MANVFCPVKTAEVSYRHQINKTLRCMMDNTGMKVKFLRLVTRITSCSTDFSYPGPTYLWLHRTKSLCNHTSDVTDKISDGCNFVGPESTYFKPESSRILSY